MEYPCWIWIQDATVLGYEMCGNLVANKLTGSVYPVSVGEEKYWNAIETNDNPY